MKVYVLLYSEAGDTHLTYQLESIYQTKVLAEKAMQKFKKTHPLYGVCIEEYEVHNE